jgi:hypothetical protein
MCYKYKRMNTANILKLSVIGGALPKGFVDGIEMESIIKDRFLSALMDEINRGGAVYSITWIGKDNTPPGDTILDGLLVIDWCRYVDENRYEVLDTEDRVIGTCQRLHHDNSSMMPRHILVTLFPAFAQIVNQ